MGPWTTSQRVIVGYTACVIAALLIPLVGAWVLLPDDATRPRDSRFDAEPEPGPRRMATGPGTIVLTFDGGLESHVEAALLLERHGWRGSFFVSPETLREGQHYAAYLSADEVADLALRGHDVGNGVLLSNPQTNASARLAQAQIDLEKLTGTPCLHLAFGWGVPGSDLGTGAARSHMSARQYGYSTQKPWFMDAPADPYRVPSLPVTSESTILAVLAHVDEAREADATLVLAFGALDPSGEAGWTPAQLGVLLNALQGRGVQVRPYAEVAASW